MPSATGNPGSADGAGSRLRERRWRLIAGTQVLCQLNGDPDDPAPATGEVTARFWDDLDRERRELPHAWAATLPSTLRAQAVDAVAFYHELIIAAVAADHARVRVLGEVAFGTSARGREEWLRFEAVCNHALASLPLWSVCAYNTPDLPQSLVDIALATHPWLRTANGNIAPNPDYVAPGRLLNGAAALLPTPAGAAATLDLAHAGDLGELRGWLRARLEDVDTTAEGAETVVLAVNEVAGNGVRHGRPPVRVNLWVTPAHILCDVTDRGPGFTDPLAGYTPPDPLRIAEHGAGLWMTRRLCDEVTTARGRTGFTVRLAVSRGEPNPATSDVKDDRSR